MLYDLIYDGQKVTWTGKGSFKATSGMLGKPGTKGSMSC